jgi:hypothetical protein
MSAVSKDFEKIVELKPSNARHLELQESVLTRIHVDRKNFLGAVQRVIQDVTPRGGDDEQGIRRTNLQGQSINPRVFPARVVDEVIGVNETE